ncbi:Glutamate receptor ionotropic, kainate 2 [Pseudolycoriella hygida]|uniref:Glutamate receptor ionotropic, kainate 2 n=1 Tax=Pseudolycoriella hygida TaxID=35572 RepID=A0A9Q0MWV5_9DIPT|nr:Glutamate receptor ionotropic, kainate 2 [Pseudolycoriella hygida]
MAVNKLILLFLTIFIVTTSAKKLFPIGAIFHNDNKEAEVAFRNAILRENMYNPRIEFRPIVKEVDRDDSFQAQKLACGLISEGVVAIFGPSSYQTTKIVGSICNTFGIPHILAQWIPEDEIDITEHHKFTRNFFPDNNFYARALSQIISDYEWKGFTVIYENDESLEKLVEILQMHKPNDSPVSIRQLPADTDNYLPLLKEIRASAENRIIIDCSPDKVMQLLQQATLVKMAVNNLNYIITSLDSHILDFSDLFNKNLTSNITTVRIMNPESHFVKNAVSDWQQEAIGRMEYPDYHPQRVKTEAALYNDAVRVFSAAFRETYSTEDITHPSLQCTDYAQSENRQRKTNYRYDSNIEPEDDGVEKWSHGMQILQMMDQKTEEGMSGRIVFDDSGRRKDFYMEILELNLDGFNKIATLDPKNLNISYTRTQDEIYEQVTQSLKNKTLIVASRIGEPFLMQINDSTLQGNDRYEGYSKDLIDEISKGLGFNYTIVIVDDNAYGSYNPKKKKWDGLVKYLLDNKADLAICDLTITYERRTAVDFTMPFMTLGISILYAKPNKEPPRLFSFMEPLSIDVWLHMATAYLCMSILLYFLAMIATEDWQAPAPVATSQTSLTHSSESSDGSETELLETIWNMHNWIWLVAGSIMQQGCDILPRAISTRLTAGLWWFFALIVISSYTANLAAFLTMERMDESIESAEDLAKQSTIKYGAVIGGSTLAFFQKSNFSTYQRMWTAMESSPSVFADNNKDGEERVYRGNRMYAFLMESTTIEYIIERKCNLTQIGGLLDSKGYGIALPVNSPYRTHISQTILKMQERGQLQKLKKVWWKEKKPRDTMNCDETSKSDAADNAELKVANVAGIFLVLLGGVIISICLGISEFLWNVHRISVDEKIPRWQVFKEEIMFAIDVRKTKKSVRGNMSECGSISNMSSKSIDTGHELRPGYHIGLERLNNEQS